MLTRTVEDAGLLLMAMAGFDPLCTGSRRAPPNHAAALTPVDLQGLRLGVITNFDAEETAADVNTSFQDALSRLQQLGAQVTKFELPGYEAARARRAVFVAVQVGAALTHGDAWAKTPDRFSSDMQGLLSQNPDHKDGGLGAFARLDKLPQMPHTAHLVPLLADNPFQESFKHLRDLQFAGGNLAHWQANLSTFTDMLDNRRSAFATRLPQVRAQAGAVDMPQLQQRRDALAAALVRAETDTDVAAFANPRERGLAKRIEQVSALLAKAQRTPETAAAAALADTTERLRRAQGALTWQLTQEFSDRSWVARKALRDTDLALAAARTRDAALVQAQQDEPARHERFGARIAELGARLQALQPRVLALNAESQTQLQDIAVAELEGQKQRLDLYAAQARLAIAQILDRAQLAQRSDKAAPAAGAKP